MVLAAVNVELCSIVVVVDEIDIAAPACRLIEWFKAIVPRGTPKLISAPDVMLSALSMVSEPVVKANDKSSYTAARTANAPRDTSPLADVTSIVVLALRLQLLPRVMAPSVVLKAMLLCVDAKAALSPKSSKPVSEESTVMASPDVHDAP